MNIVLCAIDAKFIHTNVALRLLKANCPLPSELFEFTIKTDPDAIVSTLLAAKPDLVAFSVYIWNVELVKTVAAAIRKQSNAKIVAGGPEVAHDATHFLIDFPFDFVIRGEGERAFAHLASALADVTSYHDIPNLAFRDGPTIRINPIEPIADLAKLASPYRFAGDEANIPRKIQYLELSRGCPYSCAYCLAPLDGAMRFFPLDRIKGEILYLMDRGARTFKFLDRTFNVRPEIAIDLFDFIIKTRREGVVFQFEITGDLLPETMIRHLNESAPPGLFRFEIGIQSTNDETNAAVSRVQDNMRLFHHIRALVAGARVTVHLDLIAGLPREDLVSFIRTFDDTFALGAPELQLGFLKLLRGTPLRREAERYGYRYDADPPYEIAENEILSKADLGRIRAVEETVEHFWNRGFMRETLIRIRVMVPSMFGFLEAFRRYLADAGFSFLRHQTFDLFIAMDGFVSATLPNDALAIRDSLKAEYLDRAKVRPKIWWTGDPEERVRTSLFHQAHAIDPAITAEDCARYGVLTTYRNGFLLVLFRPDEKRTLVFPISPRS